MPALDRYEDADIDDDVEDADVSFEARLRAERELDRRDVREGRVPRRRRLPGALEGTAPDMVSWNHQRSTSEPFRP